MKVLTKNELKNIKGGISLLGILSLLASIIFGVGALDGISKGECKVENLK